MTAKPKKFSRTPRQMAIMNVVLDRAARGEKTTTKDIRDAVPELANCSIQAFYCSLEFLEKTHGMIVKVPIEIGKPWEVRPTKKAFDVLRPTPETI